MVRDTPNPATRISDQIHSPLEEVVEIEELYLLIKCTKDILQLYNQLEQYDNKKLQKGEVV